MPISVQLYDINWWADMMLYCYVQSFLLYCFCEKAITCLKLLSSDDSNLYEVYKEDKSKAWFKISDDQV